MYPWLHMGPFALSTYSLLFLCAFIVGGIVTYLEAKRLNRACGGYLAYPFVKWMVLPLISSFFSSCGYPR